MIVTFYAYKGGTGRTMALANIAALLAKRGRRVLAVDFDLEAPGLWRFFNKYKKGLNRRRGLIDLLVASAATPGAEDIDWRDFVTQVQVDSFTMALMTSGRLDNSYSSKVLSFDWEDFFRNSRGGEFFEQLRHAWHEDFDFVLIDSRTGITDSGGICTIVLPDLIVPVFVSNLQSIEGAVEVIARAQIKRRSLAYDRSPALVLPILSRFDSRTEYEFAQEWLNIGSDRVKDFYNDWLPKNVDARHALERTKLPYVAYFSFGETLPAVTEGISDPESLGYAFNSIANLIEGELASAGAILSTDADSTSMQIAEEDVKRGRPWQVESNDPSSRKFGYTEERADIVVSPSENDEPFIFRDRDEELRRVLDGLGNTAGSHFWYVIGPPQIGKSWLLKHIGSHLASSEREPWDVHFVDLREQSTEVRGDASSLVALLFGHASPHGEEGLRIAQRILRLRQPHLWLLDSAELLNRETAVELRLRLSEIHQYVEEQAGRFAFIVASCREDEWRGVFPARFNVLPLTEFTVDVVQAALSDLAIEMGRPVASPQMWEQAMRVHRVTEGLPVLLGRTLRWVRDEHWMAMYRLETQEQFEEFADPYIQEYLLTPAALLTGEQRNNSKLRALIHTYRVLVPYRLFTYSHLRHYYENDRDFQAAIHSAEWSLDDLWLAIRGTALLKRPLMDPWKEIHPPIRRLLYRYFYRTDDERYEVQCEAREFVEAWSDGLAGIEQAVGVVECLWHEAALLRMREPATLEEVLSESARALSRGLRASGVSLPELREYAAERMRLDREFEDNVGDGDGDGWLSRLAGIVVDPGGH